MVVFAIEPAVVEDDGSRFQLTRNATINAIGGNLNVYNYIGNGNIFGAVVRLTSMADFPDSINLSTPDVLAYTVFTGTYPSTDMVVPIGPINVGPGTYGVIFGSGLFGATGEVQ